MLRFLLDKFRQAPGPMKQARLIAADLAEEMLDLAEHYKRQFLGTETESADARFRSDREQAGQKVAEAPAPEQASERTPDPLSADGEDLEPTSKMDITPELRAAIGSAANRKRQEFKVLAILWEASDRKLGSLSAKEISEHGEKLGLSIRHENVRKVIRMRLKKHVVIRREPKGNSTIFHYRLSASGYEYFRERYLLS